ncbi:MAG: DUF3463 domain-containing protein [Candidatus Cloacimonetes bacterium]|nr:DUF3463 domain-containing protein [Candidatus Cloacimonadota bacterium]
MLKIYLNIVKSRFFTHYPLALTHHVTSRCNAKCSICDLWKRSKNSSRDLTLSEICQMLKSARNAGIISYTAFGGEPLLRKEICDILDFSKKLGFLNSLITNGYLLPEMADKIIPLVDYLIISLDSNDELHDEIRGIKGLRNRIINGIELTANRTNVIINTVISNLNLDKIDGLMVLAKAYGVSITFEPMAIYKGFNEHLAPSIEDLNRAFSKILAYKKSGFPVGNSQSYLSNFTNRKKYVCHAPKIYIKVDFDGRIYTCQDMNWGNIKDRDFKEIFKSKSFRDFCKINESCNKCVVSCVLETSQAYSLDPAFFIDKIRSLISVR